MAAPPPVPALPVSSRSTSYSISAATGPYDVGFHLYGTGTNYGEWIAVSLDDVELTHGTDWTLASATGPLATIPRPITDAKVTLTSSRTGTLVILGDMQPSRLTQFNQNQGVAARDLNVAFSGQVAVDQELRRTIDTALAGIAAAEGLIVWYLGARAGDPPTGGLVQGQFYFNLTAGEWRIWNGSAFVTSPGPTNAVFGVAGGGHSTGLVPDPGSSSTANQVLTDQGWQSGTARIRFAAQPAVGKVCNLLDYGMVTRQSPGVNNATVWNGIAALATRGDTFIAATVGDVDNYGELTFFTQRPNPMPDECILRGPGGGAGGGAGWVRDYDVSDFREPFVTLAIPGCTVRDLGLYIHAGRTSGSAIGIVGGASDFIIHPHLDNIFTTCFDSDGIAQWAIPLCLDGSAGVYASGGRGVRDAHVHNCNFWQYSYAGMYLSNLKAGDISGIVLVPPGVDGGSAADIVVTGGTATENPTENTTISGPQLGVTCIIDYASSVSVLGSIAGLVSFVSHANNCRVVSPVFGGDPSLAGTNNIAILGNFAYSTHALAFKTPLQLFPKTLATLVLPPPGDGSIQYVSDGTTGKLVYGDSTHWYYMDGSLAV